MTQGLKALNVDAAEKSSTVSRHNRRESDVWQRRYWEHTIRDWHDFKGCLDYVHFNPVKHGQVACPHFWEHSSFQHWVRRGEYHPAWCCRCDGRTIDVPEFPESGDWCGEE